MPAHGGQSQAVPVDLTGLHHLILYVADLAAATAAWGALFSRRRPAGEQTSSHFGVGDEYVELRATDGLHEAGSVAVSAAVADLPAAVAALAARAVDVCSAGPDGFMIDPAALTGVHLMLTDGAPAELGGSGGVTAGVSHIVVAVSDLDKALHQWTDTLGLQQIERPEGHEASRHLRVGRAWFGLTEAGTDGPAIARFLERRGEGVYALGLRVADRARAAAELSDRGARLIEAPSGQVFIHPASTHGLLVDLVQPAG